MPTIAEKFAAAKKCCRETLDRKIEESRAFYDKFFNDKWNVFVIKRDEATGEVTGKKLCCAECPT